MGNARSGAAIRPDDVVGLPEPEGRRAWLRLATALALSTIGGVGMWSVIVALPSVGPDFGVDRAGASLPYVAGMVGLGLGGVATGRLADRFGIATTSALGIVLLAAGYALAAAAPSLFVFALAHGLLIGIGASASFGPLIAHVSLWFTRRRGLAVAICACGNYLAGTVWPPLVGAAIARFGWRPTHLGIALVCLLAMPPLALLLRGPVPAATPAGVAAGRRTTLVLRPTLVQALLVAAGLCCCVAMAMPQVHIVAYCGDLGFGVARGAEMLSLMLGFGVVSRLLSGYVADRIGGLPTLLAGSVLQGVALLLYFLFDGLAALYVISALFGLFQGGLVPSYAVIVREVFPAREAGGRIGLCIMATLFGMALGGWLSGVIFDATGSYRAAFLNGLGWNLLNVAIAVALLLGRGDRPRRAGRPGRAGRPDLPRGADVPRPQTGALPA